MAQAGLHGLVGTAVRRWAPARRWLILGIVLGNLVPDLDNLAVAAATLMGRDTAGLHRTVTHSLFFVAAVVLFFYLVAALAKRPRWQNLGLGLGIGILLHILLDLLIWFNGVDILWPLDTWINPWAGVTPAAWWMDLMMPAEFLCFALYFAALAVLAQRQGTNLESLRMLQVWTAVQLLLFVLFMVLLYTLDSGFMTIYGAGYLLSLLLAFGITIQMQATIEGALQPERQGRMQPYG